ncbi:MAG: EVE domain-containing protein [Bdellovibrionales bacterium]
MHAKNTCFWLMKSEPSSYSIDDFKKEGATFWEGVRNYQARNFMIHNMKLGDSILFYHSNAKPSGVVGLGIVSKHASPDQTALDKKSKYFDPKATQAKPRWFAVTVKFRKKFPQILTLEQLRKEKSLKNMLLLKKGQRLSILPVTKKEFEHIIGLTKK